MGAAGQWCILRTAARNTLGLAESLAAQNFEVWTPIETRRVRVPRMNARRIVKDALLKGFVFASHDQRYDLMEIAEERGRHARFSFIREANDEIARILDSELDGLRWIEARVNVSAKKIQHTIPEGVTVRVSTGLFSGMTGVVRRSKRGLTLVCFNDRYSAEIPTSLLEQSSSYRFQSATGGPAALAA
jgi:predicted RNA-binding protein associated with RNAse of E/G family